MMRLPAPFQTRRATSELALPKTDPRVERKVHIMRRAEEMCMVRHQDVATDRPFASFAQTSMGLVAGKPQFAVFRWDVGSPSPHNADRKKGSDIKKAAPSFSGRLDFVDELCARGADS